MKILVCGSRTFADEDLLGEVLGEQNNGISITIISGGARGADMLAEAWAEEYGFNKIIHHADWDTHGKSAGFIRNQQMIDENPDLVIAFWDGKSKGTKHTLGLAKQKKIRTLLVYF